MNMFRTLTAAEIECRVAQINDNGLSLLLYKDARCDMAILDETVGAENWKRGHEIINGNLFCNVSLFSDARGEWVTKQDVGVESNTEAEKGQASDSFKRACVNWGIGRELYTAPFIWISSDKYQTYQKNGKPQCKDRFEVTKVSYNERREISGLEIINCRTKDVVFQIGAKPKANVEKPTQTKSSFCADCGKQITDYKDKTAKDLEIYSHVHFGRFLCGKCIIKAASGK